MRMLAGRWTVEFLAELNFAVAFVSAAGLTLDQGLTTARRPLADVVNAARASAERSVGPDRRDQVRARLAAGHRARAGARCNSHRRRAAGRGRGRVPRPPACGSRSPTPSRRVHESSRHLVHRPVGRPAARPSSPPKCAEWGFDGLELACWGDHFDVAAGGARPRLRRRAAQAARAARARRLGDRQPPRRPGRVRPDRRAPQGACSTPRSGATAIPRACGSAPPSG